MSNLYDKKFYNNYHYNQKIEEPDKLLGTTFNPYQPKVSNQVIQEQYNQSLSSTLFKRKTPKKIKHHMKTHMKRKQVKDHHQQLL